MEDVDLKLSQSCDSAADASARAIAFCTFCRRSGMARGLRESPYVPPIRMTILPTKSLDFM